MGEENSVFLCTDNEMQKREASFHLGVIHKQLSITLYVNVEGVIGVAFYKVTDVYTDTSGQKKSITSLLGVG